MFRRIHIRYRWCRRHWRPRLALDTLISLGSLMLTWLQVVELLLRFWSGLAG